MKAYQFTFTGRPVQVQKFYTGDRVLVTSIREDTDGTTYKGLSGTVVGTSPFLHRYMVRIEDDCAATPNMKSTYGIESCVPYYQEELEFAEAELERMDTY